MILLPLFVTTQKKRTNISSSVSDDIPADYAGIVLIGGMSWFTPEAALIVPLVKDAVLNKKLVAGICNASVFLGMHGFLNEVNHTSNAGFSALEFCREILYALEAYSPKMIEKSYRMNKTGVWEAPETE